MVVRRDRNGNERTGRGLGGTPLQIDTLATADGLWFTSGGPGVQFFAFSMTRRIEPLPISASAPCNQDSAYSVNAVTPSSVPHTLFWVGRQCDAGVLGTVTSRGKYRIQALLPVEGSELAALEHSQWTLTNPLGFSGGKKVNITKITPDGKTQSFRLPDSTRGAGFLTAIGHQSLSVSKFSETNTKIYRVSSTGRVRQLARVAGQSQMTATDNAGTTWVALTHPRGDRKPDRIVRITPDGRQRLFEAPGTSEIAPTLVRTGRGTVLYQALRYYGNLGRFQRRGVSSIYQLKAR